MYIKFVNFWIEYKTMSLTFIYTHIYLNLLLYENRSRKFVFSGAIIYYFHKK